MEKWLEWAVFTRPPEEKAFRIQWSTEAKIELCMILHLQLFRVCSSLKHDVVVVHKVTTPISAVALTCVFLCVFNLVLHTQNVKHECVRGGGGVNTNKHRGQDVLLTPVLAAAANVTAEGEEQTTGCGS